MAVFNHILSRMLDTVGDGSGTKIATANYASATEFKIAPPADKAYAITRLLVHVADTGNLDPDAYGVGITLTNGIKVEVRDGSGLVYSLTDTDLPVKKNADWGSYSFDTAALNYGAAGPTIEHYHVRWSFFKSDEPNSPFGETSNIILFGTDDTYFAVTLEDNFTGLDYHTFCVQGEIIDI